MARSTRLVILIKNIYTLWGRKRFLLPATYFPKNLVYPFTLRVMGIKIVCFHRVVFFGCRLLKKAKIVPELHRKKRNYTIHKNTKINTSVFPRGTYKLLLHRFYTVLLLLNLTPQSN